MAGEKVFELNPNLGIVADFHLEMVERARAGAFRVDDFSVQREKAVVAGAKIGTFGREVVDKTAGMRADDVEGLDGFVAGPQ